MDEDQLLHILAHRRSFGLKEIDPQQPVDQANLKLILEAANWAPSHGKTEPWRFVVYQGSAIERLSNAFGLAYRELYGSNATLEGEQKQRHKALMAPVWIAIGVQLDPRRPEWEELVAVGCAIQNAHLMASHLGLAAKWSSGAVAISQTLENWINWPGPTKLLGFFYVGHPLKSEPWPKGERQAWDTKVRWEA